MMDISKRERVLLIAILILFLSNLYFIIARDKRGDGALYPEDIDSLFIEQENPKGNGIAVHVAGQVNNRGVVYIEEGSRVIDAIEAAGGTGDEADLDVINLAKVLADGEKVYIPALGENRGERLSLVYHDAKDERIDINTASASQLETLQGIGKVLAGRIIDFREKEGPFRTPEDIMKVSGIGPKVYEKIKDSIRVR